MTHQWRAQAFKPFDSADIGPNKIDTKLVEKTIDDIKRLAAEASDIYGDLDRYLSEPPPSQKK